jgi:hypothetical protein
VRRSAADAPGRRRHVRADEGQRRAVGRRSPVWSDRATCTVSMRRFPIRDPRSRTRASRTPRACGLGHDLRCSQMRSCVHGSRRRASRSSIRQPTMNATWQCGRSRSGTAPAASHWWSLSSMRALNAQVPRRPVPS